MTMRILVVDDEPAVRGALERAYGQGTNLLYVGRVAPNKRVEDLIKTCYFYRRLDPASPDRIPEVTDHDQVVVVLCSAGYTSSLAAATLQDMGFRNATDVAGGFQAWKAAGLPVG